MINTQDSSSTAILVRKKDIYQYLKQNINFQQDYLQQIYEEYAKSLKQYDANSHEFILKNRSFHGVISLKDLEKLIDSYYKSDQAENKLIEQEIIRVLSVWMPDISFNGIIPINNQKGQLKRVVLQCTSILKDVKIKFYMKITARNTLNLGDMVQEKEHFNQISSYSARFLSMKYQKVISEHVIITAPSSVISKNQQGGIQGKENIQNKNYLDIVLTDYCEYTLRQIIYYSKQATTKQQQNQELIRQKCNTTATNYGSPSLQLIQNSLSQPPSLIEKFSFQHLQKDLIEALFFMHTRGYIHNSINLDNIFYDKYINAFVIGGFDTVTANVRSYEKFHEDIRQFGLILIEFLLSFYNIKIQEDLYTLDDQMIRNLIENLNSNKIISSKKNFILLNLNIYQQRNILLDIFNSPTHNEKKQINDKALVDDNSQQYADQEDISNLSNRPYDIVELAISFNIQHCLVSSSHSTMRSFLTQNEAFDEKSLVSYLIDPLNNKYSYWKYKGTIKNGLFDGPGEIYFEPPQLFDQLDDVLYSDCDEDLATSKKLSIVSPPANFNATPSKFKTLNSFSNCNDDSYCPELESHRQNIQMNTPHTVSRTASKAGMHFFNISNYQGIHDRLSLVRNEESNYFQNELKQKQVSKKIFKGIWENGFNQKYLNYVTTDQFKDLFLLNNYMKIIQHHSHQELQFGVKSEKPTKAIASSKIIDLQFSVQKENVIDSLNVITKYLQIPISRITFDLKGINFYFFFVYFKFIPTASSLVSQFFEVNKITEDTIKHIKIKQI